MNIDIRELTVAQIVSKNIKSAHIFKKYGIDFCCGGGVSVAAACDKVGVDSTLVFNELSELNSDVNRSHDYQKWSLDYLIMHIENIHHSYVKEALPMLVQYAEKVARVHGGRYDELLEIKDLVEALSMELMSHLLKEERVLFPVITSMVQNNTMDNSEVALHNNISMPIEVMMGEHESAGDMLKSISTLTQGYQPPVGACNTFRAFYAKLEEFEQDLHLHIHLENNILFPKAIELMGEMNAKELSNH